MDGALSVDALSPKLSGIGRYCWELANRLPLNPQIAGVDYFQGSQWFDDPGILLSGGHAPLRHRKPWKTRLNRWWRHSRFRNGVIHAPNYFLPDWATSGKIGRAHV